MEKKQVELTGKVDQKIYQTDFQGEVVCLVYLTEISGAGALLEAGFSPPEGVRVYVDRVSSGLTANLAIPANLMPDFTIRRWDYNLI